MDWTKKTFKQLSQEKIKKKKKAASRKPQATSLTAAPGEGRIQT